PLRFESNRVFCARLLLELLARRYAQHEDPEPRSPLPLARVRHTNSLVIADRCFPFWPKIETIDISLTDDVPTLLQVLAPIRHDFHPVNASMAREFLQHNSHKIRSLFAKALEEIPTTHEPHITFKKRVPTAIGLIRTGDTIQYSNMILVSG